MNPFVFEETPWDREAGGLKLGDRISAARFLTLLEGEEEPVVEDAFQTLEDLSVTLDLSDLFVETGSDVASLRLRREEQLVKSGDLPGDLEENDPLRLYLEELARIPAAGEISILLEQLEDANREERNDSPVQNRILNLSLSRVVEIAGEFVGYGVLLMDLIQEGSMGLWQGILCYDGGDFEGKRDWWIRHYMAKAVVLQARANGVGRKMRQAMEDYRSVDEKLLMELGRNATVEEIAQQLHMSEAETRAVAEMLESARLLRRVKEVPEPEGSDPEEESAVENTAYFQMRQRIEELLSGLSEQDAKLLSLRFGLEGGLPMSPEETGRKMGLTPEEVVARETAALALLRK